MSDKGDSWLKGIGIAPESFNPGDSGSAAARGLTGPGSAPRMKGAGFSVSVPEIKFPAKDLGPFKCEAKLELKAEFKPKEAKPGGGAAHPIEVKGGAKVGGNEAKVAAEKELNLGWSVNPKMVGELSVDKKGVNFKLGGMVERKGFEVDNLELGGQEYSIDMGTWKPGEEPKIALTWKTTVKAKGGSMKITGVDYDVTSNCEASIEFKPAWEKLLKMIGEKVGIKMLAQLGGAAGAAAIPIGVFIGGLIGWAKAGHEFDELADQIEAMHNCCLWATNEALGQPHITVNIGSTDLFSSVGELADKIRKEVAGNVGVPEAALAMAAKAKPALRNAVYKAAWDQSWPPLKSKLLAHYQDTTWTSYEMHRNVINAHGTGSFAPEKS